MKKYRKYYAKGDKRRRAFRDYSSNSGCCVIKGILVALMSGMVLFV